MSKIQTLLDKYAESHQDHTNKLIHWICVPSIVFSLVGMLYAIPFPVEKCWCCNWGAVAMSLSFFYYLGLSFPLSVGLFGYILLVLLGNSLIYDTIGRSDASLFYVSVAIFVIAWIGQFIGHKIEGKKPSFLEDVQFLLIGPAWLLHFIYKKLGLPY